MKGDQKVQFMSLESTRSTPVSHGLDVSDANLFLPDVSVVAQILQGLGLASLKPLEQNS